MCDAQDVPSIRARPKIVPCRTTAARAKTMPATNRLKGKPLKRLRKNLLDRSVLPTTKVVGWSEALPIVDCPAIIVRCCRPVWANHFEFENADFEFLNPPILYRRLCFHRLLKLRSPTPRRGALLVERTNPDNPMSSVGAICALQAAPMGLD
jgi:hypothetical protein